MRTWVADGPFPSFECTTLPLAAEDDGELVATVLRKRVGASKTAFLYVHGFVDYFFHEHVANAVVAGGMDFYAIDLRRFGRSMRGGNRPNYCTHLSEYYAEITSAIDIMLEDGIDRVVLYAHSMGGLVASLYAHEGARRDKLAALVLNSPFFGFKVTAWQQVKLSLAIAIGAALPTLSDPHAISPWYGEALHTSKRGEWNYDLRWKPINGFPAYFGWARAIKHAHDTVHGGLSVQCPVLVLHSDASGGGNSWSDSFMSCDIVLDVNHMREYSGRLGKRVERQEIAGAMHDVMLSRLPVRTHALNAMSQWLSVSLRSSP